MTMKSLLIGGKIRAIFEVLLDHERLGHLESARNDTLGECLKRQAPCQNNGFNTSIPTE